MAVFAPRYAHAFAQVAEANHLDAAAALQQMRDFAVTLKDNPELTEVLLDPSIPEPQKVGLLDAIAGRMEMPREVRNFVAVIMDHHRLGSFEEIVAEYALVADEESGLAEAEIVSAHPLDEDDRRRLEAEVARLAGGRVRASYRQDASLLGGAVVKIGSTVYDGSVKAQLQTLKQQLINA